jgi:hypothetical protein
VPAKIRDRPISMNSRSAAVSSSVGGEGWHGQRDGNPVTADQAAGLLGNLRLLGLTTQERLGEPPCSPPLATPPPTPRRAPAPAPPRLTRAVRGTAASAEPGPVEALQQARLGACRARMPPHPLAECVAAPAHRFEVLSYRIGTARRGA